MLDTDTKRRIATARDILVGKVPEIQTHSMPVIEHCYREFLLQNHDPDEREYADAADQNREVLIHNNYLSQKDIEICHGFDIEPLVDRAGIAGIRDLHAALVEKYTVEDAADRHDEPVAAAGAACRR